MTTYADLGIDEIMVVPEVRPPAEWLADVARDLVPAWPSSDLIGHCDRR